MFRNLEKELAERGISRNRLALMAMIAPSDLFCALSGKKPMYPSWRKRIADALNVPENVLFSEEESEVVND